MIAHVAFGLVLVIAVPGAADVGTQTTVESGGPGPAAEVNVLWPFIGVSELKLTIPVVGVGERRGELLVYRQSRWDEEKKVAPVVDVNVGCRV